MEDSWTQLGKLRIVLGYDIVRSLIVTISLYPVPIVPSKRYWEPFESCIVVSNRKFWPVLNETRLSIEKVYKNPLLAVMWTAFNKPRPRIPVHIIKHFVTITWIRFGFANSKPISFSTPRNHNGIMWIWYWPHDNDSSLCRINLPRHDSRWAWQWIY